MSKQDFYESYYLVNHKTYERLIVETGIEGAEPYFKLGFVSVSAREFDRLEYYAVMRVKYLEKLAAKKLAARQYQRDRTVSKKFGLTPRGKQLTTKPKR